MPTAQLTHRAWPSAAPLSKEDADCCMIIASRDPLGRAPIGFCDTWEGRDSTTMPCLRRLDRAERLGIQ